MPTRNPPLAPHRALVHPLWLASLAVLALNDHVLKGANLLSPFVTGKLSDFAGLLVAPTLLAALVGIRRVRSWWLAHLAVGLVFSAIQLHSGVAAFWSEAMGVLGAPWVIVCDPTDLVALPMLLVSARVFARAMRAGRVSNLRRSAEWAVASGGLAVCVATSPPPGELQFAEIFTDVYLHNASDEEVVVRLRTVSLSVDYDCDAIAVDPGRLLTPAVFGPAQTWSLRPQGNMVLLDERFGRSCHAVMLDVDHFVPAVVFWRDGEPPQRWIAGRGLLESENGWIALDYDAQGRGRWKDQGGLLHLQSSDGHHPPAECSSPSDASRLDWSTAPVGSWTLLAVNEGIDGCLALSLSEDDQQTHEWYLCVPRTVFPFEVGERIDIDRAPGGAQGWVDALRLRTLPSEQHTDVRELVVSRGSGFPDLSWLVLAFVVDAECPSVAEPSCGTVETVGSIRATRSQVTAWARAGVPPSVLDLPDGGRIELMAVRANQREVLNPDCALGPDGLGPDIELVAVYHQELR